MTTSATEPTDPTESPRLNEFFHACPVGLVAFGDDGAVRLANPAAVSLLLPAAGSNVLSNVVDGLEGAWPELAALIQDKERPAGSRVTHRLQVDQLEDTTWLSLTLRRVEDDHNMLVVADITADVATEMNVRDRELRLRTLFDSIDEGYCVAEIITDDRGVAVDYRFLEVNPLFEEMTGLSDVVGRTALEVVPDLERHWVETYARVALGKETLRFEQGSEAMGRWFDVFSMPVEPAGRFAIVFKDISDKHRWEQAIRESAQFTRRVLDNLFAFVGVMTPDGTLIEANKAPLEAAGLTSEDVIGTKFWDTYWWSHSAEARDRMIEASRLAAAGEVVRYDAEVRIGEHERIWIDFQLAPLRDDDGTITHLVPSGLDITDRREAEQQREHLLTLEQRARRQTELLLQNAKMLAAAVTVEELGRAVIDGLVHGLSIDIASLNIVEQERLRVMPSGAIREFADAAGIDFAAYRRGMLDVRLPGPEAIRINDTILCHTFGEITERYPDAAAALASSASGSLMAAPLRGARGQVLGSLVVVAPDDGWLDDEMLALLRGFVEQTGLALERAQLFDRVVDAQRKEHEIALNLQEALLPDRLVAVPALEMEADYRAGNEMLAVGGDWYDTFLWPEGLVGIVVGDVAGHDLVATAAMGRLRAAVAALAPLTEPRPTAVMAALEHCAAGPGGTDFMTAVCVVIDTVSGRVSYATAGHPPPLVIGPDGTTTWLDGANSLPVGVSPTAQRSEAHAVLEPGSTLVLYTDGLIERPGEPITTGLERLADVARRVTADTATASIPAELVGAMSPDGAPDGTADDIVAVVARWTPVDPGTAPDRNPG